MHDFAVHAGEVGALDRLVDDVSHRLPRKRI
jgi:hypothetical protein